MRGAREGNPDGEFDGQGDVVRASEGDGAAAERVVARWAPSIEQYLRRHAGVGLLRVESASDLAQSVCREALDRIGRGALEYRGEAPLRQWLYGAADLKIKNRRRYYGADGRDPGRVATGDVERVPADDPTPSVALGRHETQEAFQAALTNLSERDRRVVELFHFEGATHAEIAARLGIEESHSRTVLARSLARLAALLRSP